ncbi:MAG: hypothetical protein P1U58_05935 [Verrucomicrobiales bacterium]|nr:hypothetical protein [Verrucomicrobiales bacterium]
MRPLPPISALFSVFLVLFISFDVSQIEGAEKEKDWLEYYYQNPSPERFVSQMKDWAEDGTLDSEYAKPALIAFLSRVIRDNRNEIAGWYKALGGLSQDQKQVLHTAMLYARISEADEIMKNIFGKRYDEQKLETKKILEMPLDKRSTIDMLWGFFYASGSEHAIRRVVLSFRFQDAPERPDGVDVPEGYQPLYKMLPVFASNSLLANAERHPRVKEILEGFLGNDSLLEPEKDGVYDVLSGIDAEKYPPIDRDGESA